MIPAFLVQWFAKSVLLQSPLGGLLKRYWKPLLVVALLAGGYLYHQHKVHQIVAAAEKRGADRAYADVAARANAIAREANAIAQKIKEQNREDNHRISAAAGTLRLSGPGKARCAPVSGPAGGHVAPAGFGDAAGSQVPDGNRAAVPWDWLVDRAEEHDLDRAEVIAWRHWYEQMVKAWPKP